MWIFWKIGKGKSWCFWYKWLFGIDMGDSVLVLLNVYNKLKELL